MTTKRKKGVLASFLAGAMALVGCSSNEINDEVRTPPKELPIATSGSYDNLTFHRVIKNFMILGGDPEGSGMGGPGYRIRGEFTKNKFKNDLNHTEGVLSMARSQSKNSGGSQFFIMTKDSPHLDGSYASFGKVIKGMDIVHNIENTETLPGDRPSEDVIIESIKVDTKGENYPKPNKL